MPARRKRARHELNSFVTQSFTAPQFHHHSRKPSQWLAAELISTQAEMCISNFPSRCAAICHVYPSNLSSPWRMNFFRTNEVCKADIAVAWHDRPLHEFTDSWVMKLESCWSHNFIWHARKPSTQPWMPAKSCSKLGKIATQCCSSKAHPIDYPNFIATEKPVPWNF